MKLFVSITFHVQTLLSVLVVSSSFVQAQSTSPRRWEADGFSLRGVHVISGYAGYWSPTGNIDGSVDNEAVSGGVAGSISHKYWLSNQWAVGPDITITDTGLKTEGETQTAVLLTSILFGVTYTFTPTDNALPMVFYVSANLGPYMSSAQAEEPGADRLSVTAFGTRPAAGFLWFLNDWLLFDFVFGYHLVSDFDKPVGTYKNLSGLEFKMGLGLAVKG